MQRKTIFNYKVGSAIDSIIGWQRLEELFLWLVKCLVKFGKFSSGLSMVPNQ